MKKVNHNQADSVGVGDLVLSPKDGEIFRVEKVGAHWSVPGSSGHWAKLEYIGDVFDVSEEELEDIVLTTY